MNLAQLLAAVHQHVPLDAPIGTRWKGASVVTTAEGSHEVAAAARIDAQGLRREQFWFDAVRVDQAVLLRLTCAERECPHVIHVRAQWAAFQRRGGVAARPVSARSQPLMAEVAISVGQQRFMARPACFPCFTPCPNHAHAPITIDKKGFDLFDDSSCLGGGVVVESNGVRRPRIPTLLAAEAYALARHLETLAAVGFAREGSRSQPDPATGPG